jgi:hypothetical protein
MTPYSTPRSTSAELVDRSAEALQSWRNRIVLTETPPLDRVRALALLAPIASCQQHQIVRPRR